MVLTISRGGKRFHNTAFPTYFQIYLLTFNISVKIEKHLSKTFPRVINYLHFKVDYGLKYICLN